MCEKFDKFNNKEEIKLLRKDYLILTEYLESIRGDMRGWTKHTDKEHRKVYYKHEKDLQGITIYLEAVIEAPMINLFTVIGEVGLFKHWVPITKESKIIGEVSHLRKCCYIKNNFPWPFTNREIFL